MNTATCPVCNWEIKDGGIKLQLGDREIAVCCKECAKQAQEHPAKNGSASK